MLGMLLGVRIYNIYTESRSDSDEMMKSTMECAFSFKLSNIDYDGITLSFDLHTTDTELLKKLVIEDEGGERNEIELGGYLGFDQEVKADLPNLGDRFIVYPSGCREHNKKECSLPGGPCENI
ncbi:MAG: hypothetical protein R6U32_07465 [Candidatus Woesearchaeota archaeon]